MLIRFLRFMRLGIITRSTAYRPRTWLSFLSFLVIVLPLFTAGCGRVGPPLPPEILIPRPVSDLTMVQVGSEFHLAWTIPALNMNGSKATTIQRFEVYRMIQPLSRPLPAPKETAKAFQGTELVTIDMANLSVSAEGGKVIVTDKFSGIDPATLSTNRYWYAVKVRNKKKQDAGFSNIAIRPYFPVPAPVERIDFKAEELMILLSWNALSTTEAAGAKVVGYNIYRSEKSQVHPPSPMNGSPVPLPHFEDRNFHFGTTYYYTVRTVVKQGADTAESFDSQEYSFKPVDVFPPKAPSGLMVVFAEGRINLLWDANFESDFAGYNVYRSEDGISFTKINDVPLKSPTYRDEKTEPGKKYSYRVTALDAIGNESTPSEIMAGTVGGPR
jgi:hypothetical protein